MKVYVQVEQNPDRSYRATVRGITAYEGWGETPEEAIEQLVEQASLYLECKEPDMLEFITPNTIKGGVL